jgi:MFS transporter, ACS family, tartrate transporter
MRLGTRAAAYSDASDADDDDAVGALARRRITRRLMPFLICLFVVAFLDRVNVGYAALEMSKDLGFDTEVLGFGAGVFFLGYFLLEIPGTLLVESWSARLWLARIIISWGLLAVLTGFVRTPTQFYVARFVLGLAEAGFFPGVIVYLSHWFRARDRAKAVAMFMAAIPVSNIFGAPVSGLILGVNWLGLAGWRWVFILEGVPALVLGVVTIFYLTDRPRDAKWLGDKGREWITKKLELEKRAQSAARKYTPWEALRHRNVLLLAVAYFCSVTSAYGFNFWLPTIVKRLSGLPDLAVTAVAALPYCAGLAAMLVVGWNSDRTGERRWHTAAALFAVCAGLLLSAAAGASVAAAVAMFCLAGAGLYSYLPGFWALPTAFLTETAAAAAVGLINSVGNLGGFVGPYAVGYLTKTTGSFYAGVVYLSCSALVSACLILCVRHGERAATRERV